MIKKSLKPKRKVFEKVDGAFHKLFFNKYIDFNNVSLEVVVEDNIVRNSHNISTRGNYLKPRRSVAFRKIQDRIFWEYGLSLASDYAAQIARDLDSRIYTAQGEESRLLVKARISREVIRRAISNYINRIGGYLDQSQFRELIEASEAQLVQLFGPEHDTISRRVYSTEDVLHFSKRFFKQSIPKDGGRKTFWETKENHQVNIINVYRKILDYSAQQIQQKELFS